MNETDDTPTEAENNPSPAEEATTIHLTGYQAYMAESLEHIRNMQDMLLESNMRIYDALIVLITVLNNGDRTMSDGLRGQHAEGTYYFPPFAVANAPAPREDDNDSPA